MAVSGTYTFNATRAEVIAKALRLVRAVDQRGVPTAEQTTNAVFALNAMIKSWRSDGIFLWTMDEVVQSLTASTIVTGTDALIYECIKNHTSAAVNRPVSGADYTSYWQLSTSTIPAVWATGQSYTGIGNYSLVTEIIGIEEEGIFFRRSGIDNIIKLIPRAEYMSLTSKYTAGLPNQMYFSRENGVSQIFLYPIPDSTSGVLHFIAIKKVMDAGATGDNLDFTEEWIDAIAFNLAYRLSSEYDFPINERGWLKKEALELRDKARSGDNEQMSIQFSPRIR